DEAYGVAIDSLGRVVVAGSTGSYFAVARLTDAGALDADFDADGKKSFGFGASGGIAHGVTVDNLNRVVVVGVTSTNGSNIDFAVARLTDAGALDPSFDSNGQQTIDSGGTDTAYGVALNSAGQVIIAGCFDYNGQLFAVA